MRAAEDYVGVLLLTVTSTLVTYSNLYTCKIMGGCFLSFRCICRSLHRCSYIL